jgi:hypothetical protein
VCLNRGFSYRAGIGSLSPQMSEASTYSKEHVLAVVRRAGWSTQAVDELESGLPDTVDVEALGSLFDKLGINRDSLTSALGGSP